MVGYLVCKALDSKLLQTTVPVRDTGTNNEFRGMKSLWVAKGTTTGSKSLAGGGSGCTPRRPSTWCAVVALGRKSKTWRGAVRIGRALKSVLGVLFTVAGAALAVLIAFWSLYPICTRCQDSGGGNHERDGDGRRGSSAGAIALAEAERNVSSTLRINQLQVRESFLLPLKEDEAMNVRFKQQGLCTLYAKRQLSQCVSCREWKTCAVCTVV